ncbi:MAG TPA: type II toxin-antitoxin system prevent-host-death family antitoxin [Actinomycetota bacterium]|nr:type II toxin-antitoxin system prevent-host-death family antitoxin [Actinomycetota bacterium]
MTELLVPLSEAKVRFHELVRELSEREVLLLRHGRPVGVMMGFDAYQALLERLEELEDRVAVFEAREEGEDARTAWVKVKVEAGLDA